VVRAFCGHGVGELFHCAPNIPHYASTPLPGTHVLSMPLMQPLACWSENKAVGVFKPGMIFTIEPMINAGELALLECVRGRTSTVHAASGTYKEVIWRDDWTASTADGKCSAQFEHQMVAAGAFAARRPAY
jgi:methionyl aminopeptidase